MYYLCAASCAAYTSSTCQLARVLMSLTLLWCCFWWPWCFAGADAGWQRYKYAVQVFIGEQRGEGCRWGAWGSAHIQQATNLRPRRS